ncbi:MAG: bifunctional DNA primase/polymerase [Pseudomonadota bacterium]|nr:bifunctional DNA primase/polymerase [Pseudomonadota bacterium]
MGLFAEWQPAYAEAGIATFPVDGIAKRPAVGNYLKAGCRASKQWALKFPAVDALGFACGSRNGVTVLDVDEARESLLGDAFARFGRSPVVIRTASGKFHAWYRHNGEKRKIRASGFDGPIDILGGGFAVAPPSRSSAGQYEFLEGSLADLANLPPMRLLDAVANDDVEQAAQSETIGEGQRNNSLWVACMKAAPSCQSLDSLQRFARSLNDSGEWAPLPADEVGRTAGSAWQFHIEGRNGFAGDRFVQVPLATFDNLAANADASYLYGLLKRNHWGREFCIANEWRKHLPCGEWSRPKFTAARQFLVDSGFVVMIRPAIKGVGPALFRFGDQFGPDGVQGGGRGRGV